MTTSTDQAPGRAADDEPLLTISTFARAVGVPGSALRYYAAEGVLVPAEVDAFTGYRYYAPAQIETGVLVGRMRATGVPVALMKDILAAPPAEAARLIEGILETHSTRSRQRTLDLESLRKEIHDAGREPRAVRGTIPGPHLASGIHQVVAATAGAAEDVSGLVWVIRDGYLELIATDRYWLAHRDLRLAASDGAGRAMTRPGDATAAAAACARKPSVEVEILGGRLRILDPSGEVLMEAASIENAVPDLSRLISSQPPLRALAGFDAGELRDFLRGPAAGQHVLIGTDVQGVRTGDGRRLDGWVSTAAAEVEPRQIQLQSALLGRAVSAVHGPDVLLGLVDEGIPVRVLSPLQDGVTCLVMPMRR